jgi:hypothetical protein
MRSLVAAVLLVLAMPAVAQWAKFPDAKVPRTKDGPNLAAKAPRTAAGKMDLSGVWLVDPDPDGKPDGLEQLVFPKYFVNVAADTDFDKVPINPEAAVLFEERLKSNGTASPDAHCKPPYAVGLISAPLPFKIVQTPKLVLILYEGETVYRQIFLDGRRTVEDPVPRFLGYSTGRWDGDTLVVDTIGFADGNWLDAMGHPGSAKLHVIERYRRTTAGHLEVDVTIDDPVSYSKPLTYTPTYTLVPDEDLLEYFCSENEKDAQHYEP